MNQHTTKLILLKRIDYGEADRIITGITQDKGKLSLLAKGVRRSKSKLAGGLELFSVTTVTYIDGRSDLKTIIGTKLDVYFRSIQKDMNRTMLAYDFLKWTNTYTEDEADVSFFELLEAALRSLDLNEVSQSHIEAWFYMKLLHISGHGINIQHDLQTNDFNEEKTYHFSFDDMSFFSHERGEFSPNHIKLLRLLEKVSRPELLLKVQDSEQLLESITKLLKRCLN